MTQNDAIQLFRQFAAECTELAREQTGEEAEFECGMYTGLASGYSRCAHVLERVASDAFAEPRR